MRKLVRLAVLAMVAVALPVWLVVPAQASKKCVPHKAAFDVKGMVTGGSLSLDPGKKKTYSGTLDVNVTQTNHESKSFKGPQTFTLSHVKLSFEHGINPASPSGSLVHLKGTIDVVAKKCGTTSPNVVIHKAELDKPKPHK
jgi:hypothetical protein